MLWVPFGHCLAKEQREKKQTSEMCHEDETMIGQKREYDTNPSSQFYLPGYFCLAALFDSRETRQDKGRVGQRHTERLLFLRSNRDELQQRMSGH